MIGGEGDSATTRDRAARAGSARSTVHGAHVRHAAAARGDGLRVDASRPPEPAASRPSPGSRRAGAPVAPTTRHAVDRERRAQQGVAVPARVPARSRGPAAAGRACRSGSVGSARATRSVRRGRECQILRLAVESSRHGPAGARLVTAWRPAAPRTQRAADARTRRSPSASEAAEPADRDRAAAPAANTRRGSGASRSAGGADAGGRAPRAGRSCRRRHARAVAARGAAVKSWSHSTSNRDIAEQLDLVLELDAEALARAAPRLRHQRHHVGRAGVADVLDEVRVHRRDARAADRRPFSPQASSSCPLVGRRAGS